MRRVRGHQAFLIAAFLLSIGSVGIVQAVIEMRHGEPPQVLALYHHRPTQDNLRFFEKDLEGRSWFARTLRPQMQYLGYLALRDTGTEVIEGRDGWWFYQDGVRCLIEALPARTRDQKGRADVIEAVLSFRDQLANRGIHLLVVPVPGKASVYPDKLTGRVEPGVLRHTNTRDLMADLSAAGVQVVDLLEAFGQARESTSGIAAEPLYLARDTHWTPAGMQVAVEAVARRILDLDWAEPGVIDYRLEPVPVQREGDVVRMLQVPRISRRFEPERVTCQRVITSATGEPYRDDPDALILVLGDSFLRIYEQDEPGSAGFIAHLARQLHQPMTSIVNDGGASTLVREELARKPQLLVGKKLVIWEFVERDIRFGLEGWKDVRLP